MLILFSISIHWLHQTENHHNSIKKVIYLDHVTEKSRSWVNRRYIRFTNAGTRVSLSLFHFLPVGFRISSHLAKVKSHRKEPLPTTNPSTFPWLRYSDVRITELITAVRGRVHSQVVTNGLLFLLSIQPGRDRSRRGAVEGWLLDTWGWKRGRMEWVREAGHTKTKNI